MSFMPLKGFFGEERTHVTSGDPWPGQKKPWEPPGHSGSGRNEFRNIFLKERYPERGW